jgi:hypothetical protein
MRLTPFIPLILFGAWATYSALTLPKWRDARYVRHPERVFWGFWHFLDNSEWTEEGRVLRNRFLGHIGIALLFGLAGIVLMRILQAHGY